MFYGIRVAELTCANGICFLKIVYDLIARNTVMPFKHVFIVGFPSPNQANLNFFMQMAGYRVTTAKDATEAVNLMLNKKVAFKNLDLILMSNCMLFMQFLDMFDGAVRLSRKFNFLVVDELDLKEKFKELLKENNNEYEVEFCSTYELVNKFNSIIQ
jgi:CheY-like chemotaxis protein